MTFALEFDELLTQTVVRQPRTGLTHGGAATFSGTPSTFAARVVNVARQVRDMNGNVRMASHEAWIASTAVLSADDKYTLPDGLTPQVLSLATYPTETGNYHTKMFFGR